MNDLKTLAKAQGCRGVSTVAVAVFVRLATPAVLVLAVLLVDLLRRGRPESPLIDQKCSEHTHGVLSANARSVFASSTVKTSSLEPLFPRQGQRPI